MLLYDSDNFSIQLNSKQVDVCCNALKLYSLLTYNDSDLGFYRRFLHCSTLEPDYIFDISILDYRVLYKALLDYRSYHSYELSLYDFVTDIIDSIDLLFESED